MIYFVLNRRAGAIKIGHSGSPVTRLCDFQVGSPDPLVILGTIPGDRPEEQALQQRFADYWIRGEWFQADESLLEQVRSLLETGLPGAEALVRSQLIGLVDEYGPEVFWTRGPIGGVVDATVKEFARLLSDEGGYTLMKRVYDSVVAHAVRRFTSREVECLARSLDWRFDSVGGWYA